MTAIGFNTDGLPSFKIGSKHLHAKGDIFAMKSLFGSSIRTKNGLIVKAFKNLSLVANSDRKHSSAFYISKYHEVLYALNYSPFYYILIDPKIQNSKFAYSIQYVDLINVLAKTSIAEFICISNQNSRRSLHSDRHKVFEP